MTGIAQEALADPSGAGDDGLDWVPPVGCDFCHRLLSAFQQSVADAQSGPLWIPRVMLGSASEVLSAECPHVEWVRSAECMEGLDEDKPQEIWVNIGTDSSTAFLELQDVGQEHPIFNLSTPIGLVRRPNVTRHPGLARVVDTEWVDVGLLRLWHDTCVREHGKRCAEPLWTTSLSSARPAWVVDTVQECIVPTGEVTQRYCALSYTWGKATQLKNTSAILSELVKPGCLGDEEYRRRIPQTIRDAFAITRALGERYIWVDSLCIVQDDAEALRNQLNQMHLIYAASTVCIIAEAACDASEGIGGIKGASRPRRSAQAVHDIAGGEQIVGSRLTLYEMGDRPVIDYHQRAWTFQEYMFARRRLIFGRNGVRWNCTTAGWSEGLYAHPVIDEACAVDHRLFLAGRWMRSPVPSLTSLTLLVMDFNVKCLTYPEDAIRAFSGIQSVLHGIYDGGLVFGHPELFFDISLAWLGSVSRRLASSSFEGDRMLDRLPSWSWIGWHGAAQFPCDAELHVQYQQSELAEGFLEPVTQWYAMPTPAGPRRAIRSWWHHFKQEARDGPSPVDGWDLVPPRQEKSRFPGQRPSTLPRTMPPYGYSTNLVNDSDTSTPLPFWYAVPLPSRAGVAVPELSEQTQYLSCRTSRAFLWAGAPLVGPQSWETCNAVALQDEGGAVVGVVFAVSEDEAAALSSSGRGEKLELAAVAKGWTAEITDARAPDSHPHDRHDGGEKIDCYFVLWIEWRQGVAYRRASGRVYASVWDQSSDHVDLILG